MDRIADVLSGVKISQVYQALTGVEPRRTGRDTWRAPATWRAGDGLNVSGDDSRGVWHDFVDDSGGGILDLVARVRGGNRADALRWVADFAGYPLEDTPLSAEDRKRWAEERKQFELDLPEARYWRRTAVLLAEETLCELKSRFFDPTAQDRVSSRELRDVTGMLARLQNMGDDALVTQYRAWRTEHPNLTGLMVCLARAREAAEKRALLAYLRAARRQEQAA